jgi:glycosyltransferase involved in cell wall biosynthesis
MKLSVAMCTYNGARYLEEQLQSITAQARPPDELVICDDASQDNTRRLLEEFAQRAPWPVGLRFNPTNLGYTKNFEQAIAYCSGDIIVLCDQDDVWRSDKLQVIEATLAAAPDAGLVFSDAEIIDEDSRPQGYSLWQCANLSKQRFGLLTSGHAAQALLVQNAVTGATMAFRAQFKELVLPIPAGGLIIHDWWIALLIGSVSKIVAINQPLISYRRHGGQNLGFRTDRDRVFPREHYESLMYQLEEMASRLENRQYSANNPQVQASIKAIKAKAKHLRTRLTLPRSKWQRVPGVLMELLGGRYHRYSNGWRSTARDLLF